MSAYARNLLQTARKLAEHPPRKPRASDLNRAVSTAYYALFHGVSHALTEAIAGRGLDDTWIEVFRSIDHVPLRRELERAAKTAEPSESLARFAKTFSKLQAERHNADYDPTYRIARDAARRLIAEAEAALQDLSDAPSAAIRGVAVRHLVKLRER